MTTNTQHIKLSDFSTDAQKCIKDNNLTKPNGTPHKANIVKWLMSEDSKTSPSPTIIATRRVLNNREQVFGIIHTTQVNAGKVINKAVNDMGYMVMIPDTTIQLAIDELFANNKADTIATKKASIHGELVFGGALYSHNKSHYRMHELIIGVGMQPDTELAHSKNNGTYVKINYHID